MVHLICYVTHTVSSVTQPHEDHTMTRNRLPLISYNSIFRLDRIQLSHIEPPFLKRVSMPLAFLVVFLLFALGACSAGTSSTTVPTQTTITSARQSSPTPTPLPAGTVLYQANWSHGLAGWPGSQGWKVVQGQLESDSSGSATFIIP